MLPDHKKGLHIKVCRLKFIFGCTLIYKLFNALTNPQQYIAAEMKEIERTVHICIGEGSFSFSEILAQKREIIFNIENFESDRVNSRQ